MWSYHFATKPTFQSNWKLETFYYIMKIKIWNVVGVKPTGSLFSSLPPYRLVAVMRRVVLWTSQEDIARRIKWFDMAREESNMEVGGEADSLSPSTLKLYEAQFFGFTPQTCLLRVYSVFQDCMYDILPVVEKVCVRQLSKGESDAAEELLRSRARECSRRLQQFLEERFKQLSERMEALLVTRCFSVPPNVLLPEDQTHNKYPQGLQVGGGVHTSYCFMRVFTVQVQLNYTSYLQGSVCYISETWERTCGNL